MSKLTAMHTLDDISDLAHGAAATDKQAKELVRTAKKGLTPIQFASLEVRSTGGQAF